MRSLKQTVCVCLIVLLLAFAAGSAGAAPPTKALDAYVQAYTSMGKAAALMFANNQTQANAQAKWVTTMADAEVKLINAQAAWITAATNARASNAKTLQTLEQVRGLRVDNSLKLTKTFYDRRQLYDTFHGAHTRNRPTQEDLLRYSRASLPERPANFQLEPVKGAIHWPEVFKQEEFYALRTQLDCLFAQRTADRGAAGSSVCGRVQQLAGQMREQLRTNVRQMSPGDYLAARKFLDSLAYEARFPARIEGVAAN